MPDEKFILSDSCRKILKTAHLLFVAVCLGSIFSIIFLLSYRANFNGKALEPLDTAVYKLFNGVFSWSFYGIIATALIYSIFTKWGFFRYRWIIVKWILASFLLIFTIICVSPVVSGLVAIRSGGFSINEAREEYSGLGGTTVRWLILEAAFFVGIIIISTMKPWGVRKKDMGLKRQTVLILAATGIFIGLLFLAANFFNLQRIRNITINEPDLKRLENGRYIGRAEVGGFSYVAEVIMTDHRIEEIKVLKNRNNSYARWAEAVIHKIIKHQTLKIDAVTGATTTSKALMKAVSNSLQSEK
jgi:uncharacterized protein with FMN-binding domain